MSIASRSLVCGRGVASPHWGPDPQAVAVGVREVDLSCPRLLDDAGTECRRDGVDVRDAHVDERVGARISAVLGEEEACRAVLRKRDERGKRGPEAMYPFRLVAEPSVPLDRPRRVRDVEHRDRFVAHPYMIASPGAVVHSHEVTADRQHEEIVRRSFTRQVGLFSGPDSPFAQRPAGAISWLEPLEAEMVVLDVACGAAHASEVIAPHVRQVVGVDLTPRLLALGAQRLRDTGTTNVL